MNKSFIDMSRPQMLYFSGLGILMITSLAVSNISSLAFSAYFEFAARKQLCAALFVFGAVLGAVAAQRDARRDGACGGDGSAAGRGAVQ